MALEQVTWHSLPGTVEKLSGKAKNKTEKNTWF